MKTLVVCGMKTEANLIRSNTPTTPPADIDPAIVEAAARAYHEAIFTGADSLKAFVAALEAAAPLLVAEERRRYERLLGAFAELQAAAQNVIDETHRIHDSEPWPVKYRAPYDAIVKLIELLGRQRGLR